MNEPRWTVDKYGALMYRLPEGGLGNPAIIFSRVTPEDVSLAAHEELVAAVRDADTLRQARQLAERIRPLAEGLRPLVYAQLPGELAGLVELLAPVPDTGAEP